MKTLVILQSNYIPWKGYFDLMRDADEFVLYDDRQYTKGDWRNRNQVKTPDGPRWITIPVEMKGRLTRRIDEVEIADRSWADSHWSRIEQLYRRTPHFRDYGPKIEALYRAAASELLLSRVNRIFLEGIRDLLGIRTPLRWSTEFPDSDGKTERLVEICRAVGSDRYLTGPAARDYIDASCFERAGIELVYKNYDGYPEYPQPHPPFSHHVTILDLIFNAGPDAPWFIWGWRESVD